MSIQHRGFKSHSAAPISDLESAKRHFRRWTGLRIMDALFKSGQKPIAYIFQRPAAPYETYCVTFKRDWYKNFSYHFPNVPDEGWGQITSLNLLLYCERAGVSWLVAIMPNGVAYKIDPQKFLEYYKQYQTEVPHLPGEVATPIQMWERIFPL